MIQQNSSISILKRSPKIGKIFMLYREEKKLVLSSKTLERLDKVWFKHLSQLEQIRIDRISVLDFEHEILLPLFNEKKYATLIFTARIFIELVDFCVLLSIVENNLFKVLFNLPLLKKVQKQEKENRKHRATINYKNLKKELKQVIKTLFINANERQNLLFEIQLRTMLRPNETVHLVIRNLNLEKHILKVENTKTLKEFFIPTTSSLELAITTAFEKYGNKEVGWIFQGQRDKNKPMSSQTLNKTLKDHGFKDILTAHGTRAIAANFFAKNSKIVQPWVAASCLQHAVGSAVERAYRRDAFYFEERIKATRVYNEWLDKIYCEVKEEVLKRRLARK